MSVQTLIVLLSMLTATTASPVLASPVIGLSGQADARRTTVTGRLDISSFSSKVLGNTRKIRVWVPAEPKAKVDPETGVLVMHDGQNLFDGATSFIPGGEWRADEAAKALIGAGLIPKIMIVGIDNAESARADEYLPRRFKMGANEIGGSADLYLRMISEELMPQISREYGVKTDRVGMIGSSLGGIVTLYAGLKEPRRYDRLGVVSPSVWIDSRAPLGWIKPPASGQRMWLDIGGGEGNSVADARALWSKLRSGGWSRSAVFYEEANAEHNETAWARRLPAMLMYLYGK